LLSVVFLFDFDVIFLRVVPLESVIPVLQYRHSEVGFWFVRSLLWSVSSVSIVFPSGFEVVFLLVVSFKSIIPRFRHFGIDILCFFKT
jgi:hypothetical protein